MVIVQALYFLVGRFVFTSPNYIHNKKVQPSMRANVDPLRRALAFGQGLFLLFGKIKGSLYALFFNEMFVFSSNPFSIKKIYNNKNNKPNKIKKCIKNIKKKNLNDFSKKVKKYIQTKFQ